MNVSDIAVLYGRLLNMLRAHAVPLILFVLLALLIEAPLVAFPSFAGSAYQGINIAHFAADEHQYLSRANEVLSGNGLGNPYLATNKDLPDPIASSVEQVLVAPLRLLGLANTINIVDYYNILNFLGIIATLILMYAFAFALSGDRFLSATAALFAVGGYSIVYNKWLFYTDFNIYGRSLYPWVSSIPFFAFLIAVHRALVREAHLWFSIIAGVLFGALWYDYFYAWSFALAFLSVLFVLFTLSKESGRVGRVALTAGIGIVLGMPIFLSLWSQFFLAETTQISYFLFAFRTHEFVMSWVGAASLALFAIFAYMRRGDRNMFFILALIAAGWIALNEQVITGRELQFGHYYWYFIVPLAIITGAYMLHRLALERWQRWVCGIVIILVFVNTAGGQYLSFPTTASVKLHEQLYAPILADLRTLPYGVVFADPSEAPYSYLITIYTADDLYFNKGALIYHTPLERVEDTLLTSLYLDARARKNPRSFLGDELNKKNHDGYTQLFGYVEGARSGLGIKAYSAEANHPDQAFLAKRGVLLDELQSRYAMSFSSGTKVAGALRSAGVKYLLWDKELSPTWDPAALSGVAVMDDRGDIILYSL
ncbi:hypothetical protein HY090_00060 [Candidatus Kaiserbacteria bacterium]|nr:hypothetical protein [Candidatus Kaiserbacteria bacterium]